MRNIKTAALLSILALSTAASAVDSTSTGYGSAKSSVGASGTYASNVSFTLPSATLTIPSAQVRPGAAFKISIPVTNKTDRAVTFTAGTVTKPSNTEVTSPSFITVGSGLTGTLTYTIRFNADTAGSEALAGTSADFTFAIEAADTAVTPQDLTVDSSGQ